LKPKAKMYAVRDSELTGFLLRVRPNGRMTWFYNYRNEVGRQANYKLGNYPGLEPEGARRLALEAAGKVAARVDVQVERKAARAEAARAKVSTLRGFIEHQYGAWATTHLRRGDVAVARACRQARSTLARRALHQLADDEPLYRLRSTGCTSLALSGARD
jgi:hypothetical protein